MQFLQPKKAWRAVCYNRHSAEDKQENSVSIQKDHHAMFATKYGGEIIGHLSDEGVSGITADRPGFQSLMKDWVQNPSAEPFEYILVYDVSRWGRFQNSNEAAYFEHLCEQHGKKVLYTCKAFPREDQEMTESIITPMERWMAAQYSRQLSGKVWYGCMRVSRDGYSAGGMACYGMARLLLDESKKPIRILNRKEHKMISNQRVTFTPLNDATTQVVKDIFNLFISEWLTVEEIVDILNEKGIPSANGGKWNNGKIIRILRNETYTGSRIYNKTSGKLKQKSVSNPRDEWAIAIDAFPAIVDKDVFWKAQERLFWSNSRRWKKGIYRINKSKKFIESELRDMFIKQGLDEDESEKKLRKFPLIYTVNYSDENMKKSNLFVIEEPTRNHDKVLAVSISLNNKDIIDDVFLIPTNDFNECNFFLMSNVDKIYSDYKIPTEKMYECIYPLLEKIK